MRRFTLSGMALLIAMLFLPPSLTAQKKLLILGSSTSTCYFGPSSFDNCYVTRLQKYYAERGLQLSIDNRAVAGDNCYHGVPLNYPVPPGRNGPRPFNNITEGLYGNPDMVLINYPSNGYDEYTTDEVMACLRAIKQAANNAGKECYITTTQPRQDPESFRTAPTRAKMLELKNRILGEFGSYAINFWDGLANAFDQTIVPEFNADGIHLNDNGHRVLFERVAEKDIFRMNSNPPPPTNQSQGLNYRYYQGEWVALPDFNSLSAVKSGASGNIDLSPRNSEEYFSFLWEGFINIPAAGVYTFEIVSDDGSKMYFNNTYSAGATALVNNDGLHERQSSAASVSVNAPGAYPVAFAYFQRGGGQVMEAYWSGPGFSRQRIPDNVFSRSGSAPSTGGGLSYKYYEGQWVSLPDFNAMGAAKSGSAANVDLSPATSGENFGFLWEGNIRIPVGGIYTFEIVSDDGSKMYFNSGYQHGANAFINNDGLHEAQSSAASVNIASPGNYPVAFAYFQRGGGRTMQVYWSGPGFSRQPVPNEAFGGGTPQPSTGSLRYRYYEGQWLRVPDFNAMSPVKSGTSSNLDLSVRNSNEHFGIIWEGFIRIPQAGNYNFEIASDDGSNLYFNSQYSAGATPLVNNDGLHEEQYANNNVYVGAPGNYPIAITYFQRGGGQTLKAFWSGPGFSRQPIPDAAFAGSANASNATAGTTATAAAENADHGKGAAISVYPNPFADKIRIMYQSAVRRPTATAALYDMSGKLVYKKEFRSLVAGNNLLQLEPGAGRPGVYIVRLDVNNKTIKSFKVVRSSR